MAVERGPITYALKIAEDWKQIKNEKDPIEYGETYYEVLPKTPWNYGLIQAQANKFDEAFKVDVRCY